MSVCSRGKPLLLLGELDKWVPMSPQRVTGMTIDQGDIHIRISGGVRERPTFTYIWDNKTYQATCVIGESGTALIKIAEGQCLED